MASKEDPPESTPRTRGKQAVVVGGTAGIGRGLSVRLARAGCNVTIVGRSEKRGALVIGEMRSAYAEECEQDESSAADGSSPSYAFLRCDCFLLSNVFECIEKLRKMHLQIDYLVCSQGMATLQGFTPSKEEGLDQKLTLHVYSRAAFARGLAGELAAADDGRFLSILSAGVHSPFRNYAKDPELSLGGYSIKNAADFAGFYTDIYVDEFSRQFSGVSFMHACPGFVATAWGTEMPLPVRWLVRCMQCCCGRSRAKCGEYMFRALANPEYARSAHGHGQGKSFFLIDEYGRNSQKTTNLHEEAKNQVAANITAVLEAGKSVAAK